MLGFQWDEGNWPKCGKHGLSRSDIEEVMQGEIAVLPDRTSKAIECRYNAVGKTAAGRNVFIVFTFRPTPDGIYLRSISARYMHFKEIAHYERQTRR
ncbi:MAG: BrnT family toxin [Beijerinckiaceae bacterium]